MTRGFITLATGDIKYYKMAVNMLKSFRLHNPKTKFAIICDRKNEFTCHFDDVIILNHANGDYSDKFSLLVDSPYDENFFIEPDCLIYRNLDFIWAIHSKESDFSCFGWNDGGIDCWFKTEEEKIRLFNVVTELEGIHDAPLFNPGYFFIRKGSGCIKMYDDCMNIVKRISNDYILSENKHIYCSGKLRDDPVFNIAMAINGFVCNAKPSEGKCISLPSKYIIKKIDAKEGLLEVMDKNNKFISDCSLLHFSTRKALEEGLYLWQCILIGVLYKNRNSILYKLLNNRVIELIFSFYRYIKTRLNLIINYN